MPRGMEMTQSSYPTAIREKLAELEHEQWIKWATSLMESENLSPERVERWKRYMVPYSELDEKTKDYDRKWADMVLEIVHSSEQTVEEIDDEN